MSETVVPHSLSEAAAALAGAAARERPVRIVGGGTKLGWGGATPPRALRLQTTHLSRVLVHDDGVTATLSAGTPMVRAQALLARSGLMFAADPQLGLGHHAGATVGGVVATADSGPLSHRYGPVRDQVIGITAALSDGTVVRSGPHGGQQQDGYDPAKLMVGSYGTLGVILTVDTHVRLLPGKTATALSSTGDPTVLRDAAAAITEGYRDLEAFDLAWRGGRGGLLAQVAGDEAHARATAVAETMHALGLDGTTVRGDDAGLWARQRAGQRSAERAVLRVHGRRDQLDLLLKLADEVDAIVVGRATLGVAYLTLDVNRIAAVRAGLPAGTPAVVLDLPGTARGAVDAWAVPAGPELELMRAVKRRFDPAGVCNPGIFVGEI
ncbi:MAG TPA: FAD-binding oxidoreductase [Solirubrobacteraceae bacterium]|nr:FAD-binding oxidoreductase [Solirubrobacteraceae bacterium]